MCPMALITCFLLAAQGVPETSSLVPQLNSSDWEIRDRTLHQILSDPAALTHADIQDALIGLLERENQIHVSENPDYDNYHADLDMAVLRIAQTTNNTRAYTALLDTSYNADSAFGESLARDQHAFPLILVKAANSRGPTTYDAILLLAEAVRYQKSSGTGLTAPPGAVETQYQAAKAVLAHRAQKDSDGMLRMAAIQAIGMVADKEDVALLQNLADSAVGTAGSQTAALRQSARRALAVANASNSAK
jgi:hypothetical protein